MIRKIKILIKKEINIGHFYICILYKTKEFVYFTKYVRNTIYYHLKMLNFYNIYFYFIFIFALR